MTDVLARVEMLKPLRHRPYRLLFGAQVASDLGDWLTLLALLSLVLYRWELGTAGWGAVLMAMTLPYAVLGPVAGVWVDRLPRRTVMVACDLARAVVVLGFVWAPNVYVVVALVLLAHNCGTFFGPARSAAVRSTVPMEDLLAASALGRFAQHTGRVLGPAIGGALVALVGAEAVFVVDAATFLLSAALLTRLPLAEAAKPRPAATRPGFWREVPTGLAHIRRQPVLALGVGAMVVGQCLTRATDSMFGPLVKQLGVDEAGLGVLLTSLGLGYVVGAAAVGQWGRRLHPLSVLGLAIGGVGALLTAPSFGFLLELHPPAVAWTPVWFLVGAGYAALGVSYGYILQRETPAELMGRVSATANALTTSLPLMAPPLVAVLAEQLGLGWVFTTAALATLALGLVVLAARRRTVEPAKQPATGPVLAG